MSHRRVGHMACGLSFVLLLTLDAAAAQRGRDLRTQRPHFAVQADGVHLFSAAGPSTFKAGAGADTFCIYGGPGSLAGKFQEADGATVDAQGWTHRDVTDQPTRWQLSDFNSPTGTQAYWAGASAAQEPGWETAPGYGNGWNALLEYRRTVSNVAAGQTIDLSFVFNHDTEPGYDYFSVEYDSAATTIVILSLDGDNKDASDQFQPLNFPSDVSVMHPIVYAGNDYAGNDEDEIVIRLRVLSDTAWSDQDGIWPTDGAAQVDNVTVSSSEGVHFDDFESGTGNWLPHKAPFAGDFSKLFARVTDLDPCRENTTPVIGFIDDGTPAGNPGGLLWDGTPIPSIGTTSVNWNYGLPGGWVVNYNGGVSFGALNLDNEWWSPPIDWDLPGTADDGEDVAGALLRFSVYRHLPLYHGFFYQWQVRGRDPLSGEWSAWADRSLVYYSSAADWFNAQLNVSDLLPVDKDAVQMRLAVRDLAAVFAFVGEDATVAPLFDNAAFLKLRIGGPAISTRTIDLFGDSFAQSGLADVSTQASRDLLDCRIDMARSVATGALITPGDSMTCDIESVIPGVAITDSLAQIRLHYQLSMNPVFEAAIRANAPVTAAGGGRHGWDASAGSVAPYQSTTRTGVPVPNRYAFDLPDVDFMYPGDVLEYYIEAVDDDGRTTTLPADLSSYGGASPHYSRIWTVRALPSYWSTSGGQPELLLWNDFGHRGGEEELLSAFSQLTLFEGVHFDTYTTKGPSSLIDNGLGSAGAHGATAAQLSGYSCIFYESGDLNSGLISDGSNSPGSGGNTNDKSNDVGLLSTWFHDTTADRALLHFGDNLASYLSRGSAAHLAYLSTIMGVQVNDADVRDEIGMQTAPVVIPTAEGMSFGFQGDFVAFGGCLVINQFDSIQPGPGAVRTHGFQVAGNPGAYYLGNSAGVVWDRFDGSGNRKFCASFPFGFLYVQGGSGIPARTALLARLLDLSGHPYGGDSAPPAARLTLHANVPNPFNPSTTLRFTLGRAAGGSVRIFNVRGELVRSLAVGEFDAGLNELKWNGTDDAGSSVASGVYIARFDFDGQRGQQKLVLLK